MCGICGIIDYNKNLNNETPLLKKMTESIFHRGPDEIGYYNSNNVLFGQSRLAIIDIQNGKQPMKKIVNNNEYIITFNGEIYNFLKLRKILEKKGYNFNTNSDTEVLLTSYIEWGTECVNKLQGIFAFCIHDVKKNLIFGARDKIGVKPLFYFYKNNRFLFGSEIKAILQDEKVKRTINSYSIAMMFMIGPARECGKTLYKDIFELKPAQYFILDNKNLKLETYWKYRALEHTDSKEETIKHVRFLVENAIKSQLYSDAPLATFLSGGLDSSIISGIAAKNKKNLVTYSVYYHDNDKYFKESKYVITQDDQFIDIVSSYIKSNHKKVILDNTELFYALYKAVDARDCPGMVDIDSSLLLFAKEIKKTHKVALSGESADEIFGGYPWYYRKEIRDLNTFPWGGDLNFKASFINSKYKLNPLEYVNNLYNDFISKTEYLDNDTPLDKRIRELFNLNFYFFMQTLLERKDRMTMANGLEVRVPFCDPDVVEYAFNIPWEIKQYDGMEKGILRKAFEDLLPSEIINRKKSPYPKTHHPVYYEMTKSELTKIINNPSSPILEIINKNEAINLIETSVNMSRPWYGQLMGLPQVFAYFIQINYWLDKYNINIEN